LQDHAGVDRNVLGNGRMIFTAKNAHANTADAVHGVLDVSLTENLF
jgi:hypothetical protein